MKEHNIDYHLDGGSGAGVSINPIAFLIVENNKVRLLPVNHSSCIDKLLDYVPDLFEKLAKTKSKLECSENMSNCEDLNCEDEEQSNVKTRNVKPHINKVARTSGENLVYNHKNKIEKEREEIAEELEDLFEEEFEYDDD